MGGGEGGVGGGAHFLVTYLSLSLSLSLRHSCRQCGSSESLLRCAVARSKIAKMLAVIIWYLSFVFWFVNWGRNVESWAMLDARQIVDCDQRKCFCSKCFVMPPKSVNMSVRMCCACMRIDYLLRNSRFCTKNTKKERISPSMTYRMENGQSSFLQSSFWTEVRSEMLCWPRNCGSESLDEETPSTSDDLYKPLQWQKELGHDPGGTWLFNNKVWKVEVDRIWSRCWTNR